MYYTMRTCYLQERMNTIGKGYYLIMQFLIQHEYHYWYNYTTQPIEDLMHLFVVIRAYTTQGTYILSSFKNCILKIQVFNAFTSVSYSHFHVPRVRITQSQS